MQQCCDRVCINGLTSPGVGLNHGKLANSAMLPLIRTADRPDGAAWDLAVADRSGACWCVAGDEQVNVLLQGVVRAANQRTSAPA